MPTVAKKRLRKPKAPPVVKFATVADLLHRLGDIPADRIACDPVPGTATERDLLRLHDRDRRGLYELIDRTLVRKPMGTPEAFLSAKLIGRFERYLEDHDLGFVYAPDALIRVLPDQVRGPDVCFTSWLKRPDGTVPAEAISGLIPDLTVEVLSPSNTRAEIARKIGEYFRGGVRVVWVIDPATRAAEVYTEVTIKTAISPSEALDGGEVLPGFTLPLAKLFERLERPTPPKRRKGKKG